LACVDKQAGNKQRFGLLTVRIERQQELVGLLCEQAHPHDQVHTMMVKLHSAGSLLAVVQRDACFNHSTKESGAGLCCGLGY